ncbi:hypothetical protein IPN41_04030 [Candidatus Falkowbacteria bacterium]|nr:MAG: hypothetical protein IPN41_04030 [Candidatus Falkowbacteria bacterium]
MFNENQLHAVEENTPPSTPPPLPKETAEANVNNTEIYYMPDNFRKSNHTVRKQTSIPGTWVLGVSILLLILLGGGLYMYWLRPNFLNGIFGSKQVVPAEIPQDLLPKVDSENMTPTDQDTDSVPISSAKQVYITFRTELASATSADNYLAIYSKYATGTKYETVKNEKEQLELANETSNLLMMLKEKNSPALDGTEDITETSTANTATLSVQRTNKRESGKVEFVLQEGQWKVSEEIWSNAISPEEVSGEFLPGTDDDQDGLTNQEEVALGTNSKASDSDGDSYEDLSEVNNGYNPTGEGKISENESLKEYRNSTFNLNILYPGSWDTKIASTEDSVIMTASDQQFIQLLVQPNTDQEDIISWYKKTFNVENIPISQLVTNQEWDGVRTPDGLTAYITNKDKSYIFIVTYNLGNNRVLNYKNIFELVLRSLKITS